MLPKKLIGHQLVKKFPALYGTRRSITAFTSTRHLSLSCVRLFQFVSLRPTARRSFLVLYANLRLRLPSGLILSGLPIKTLCATSLFPIRAIFPYNLILLDFVTRLIFGDKYRSLKYLEIYCPSSFLISVSFTFWAEFV